MATTKNLQIKIKKLREDAKLPQKKTEGAAGFDLYTAEDAQVFNVRAYEKAVKIPLGFAMEIPEGYHAKIFLRSSTGANTKIRMANGTAIIDNDYRGEVMLIVENLGTTITRVPKGTRIAQMMIEKNIDVDFKEVQELASTKRGTGGVGSTGGN